jgi:signal transduction histidine kinase
MVVTIIPMTIIICGHGRVLDRLHAGQRQAAARMRRRQRILEREVVRQTRAIAEEAAQNAKVERALREAQKSEVIGQLTGGVAHEFNNLLTAIIGNLELIRRHLGGADAVDRFVMAALRSADRGSRLIHQLLVFSGGEVMNPEMVSVNRLIAEFEPVLRQAIGASIDLDLWLEATPDVTLLDAAQCEAALLNLVINARDALPGRGRIIIKTTNSELDPNPDRKEGIQGHVLLTVSDDGHGIPGHILPRVFDPFFTTKDVGKGTGLGLSQVQGFARESRGHAEIRSEVGVGTTVRLFLPCSPAVGQTVQRARRSFPIAHGRQEQTVLVVEDDEAVCDTAVAMLIELGYRVAIARDGQVALAILEGQQQVDILLSDVVMPRGMTGVELARKARQLRPQLKILLTSGYAREALAAKHQLTEDMPLLAKPYRQGELARQLDLVK